MSTPLFSSEAAQIQAASRQLSERLSEGLSEVHAQIGVNIGPCPKNCAFCSFAACNSIFAERIELAVDEVIARVQGFERDGANAIYLMATAGYPLSRFLDYGREVRRAISPATIPIANIEDLAKHDAVRLKNAGVNGIYHALRLGEGKDNTIQPEKRLATFRHAREARLLLGTCVEPVGPEHTIAELVEKTIINREAKPVFSGAARPIPIPGTPLAHYGMVSEARMAHILSVVRLAVGCAIPGNCTHEPTVIGSAAGANLLWAETGSNPRDIAADTDKGRGTSVAQCLEILREAEWKVLNGPSHFFRNTQNPYGEANAS